MCVLASIDYSTIYFLFIYLLKNKTFSISEKRKPTIKKTYTCKKRSLDIIMLIKFTYIKF